MGLPRFLTENFFDPRFFAAHVVSASSELVLNESWRVGGGRRALRNFWTPTASGVASISVACNRVRYADMLVVDRNSNLMSNSASVKLEASNDGFTTSVTVFDVTAPSSTQVGGRTGTPGVLNEEGAWLLTFAGRVALEWRLTIQDMGGGLKPQIGGLYLGQSWQPRRKAILPWDDEARNLQFDEFVSDSFWVGSNRPASRREIRGHLIRLDRDEYAAARYHFHGIYYRGGFCWYVPDVDQAERALLLRAPRGVHSIPAPQDWPGRLLVFTGNEEQPSQRVAIP